MWSSLGYAMLDALAEEKLRKMGAALADRPTLQREIAGHIEKEKDLDGPRMYRFERKLKPRKVGETAEKETEGTGLDHVTISHNEYLEY